MNKKYTLYAHVNKINGKVYIGITSQKPEHRWNNGKGYNNTRGYFKQSIIKYGWDNFHHVILQTDLSKYEACRVEIELISYYKKHNISYNNSDGGDINTGWHYTMLEETKQKISKSNKGRNISDITRKKISESLKGKLTGEKNPMYGKHFTEESKIKLINSLKGKMSGKNILCMESIIS